MQTYEVILNGPALGLVNGDNVRTVTAARFERNPNDNTLVFYDESGAQVAFFQHALSVMVVPA